MENAEARELTRAIEALNNNIGNLTRDLQGFATNTIAQNPVAAGQASGRIAEESALQLEFARSIKSVAEEAKKEVATQKDNSQELSKLLRQYRQVNESIENELRLRKEGLKLNEEQLKKEREILTAQYANEQAETRARIKSLGYEVPEQSGDKGILSQLKDHFLKSDMSMKGLALSGGIMAISMALDAVKALWGGIKEEAMNMNKNLRQNQQTALSAQGGIGTGDFQTQQLRLAQNMAETDRFFIAAGVSAEQFSEAMIVNARRLGESLSDAGTMRESVAEMTVHARAAGVALREYQDTVADLTRTNQMDISQKDRAMQIADRIYATEREMNLEKGYLINNIKSTYQSLATMGYSIENVVGLNIRFAEAIKAGRMSLSDIIDYAKGMKDATEGQRLFFGRAVQQYGSARGQDVESAVRELSGGDPVQYSYLMQKLIEGAPDARLTQATGLTDKTAAAFMRDEAGRVASAMYMARGGTAYGAEAWSERFRGLFGMATPQGAFARGQILDAAGKPLPTGTAAPTDAQLRELQTSTSKLTTVDEKLGVIKDTFINYVAEKMYGVGSAQSQMQKAISSGDFESLAKIYGKELAAGTSAQNLQSIATDMLSSGDVDKLSKSAGKMGITINVDGGDVEKIRRILSDELQRAGILFKEEYTANFEKYRGLSKANQYGNVVTPGYKK